MNLLVIPASYQHRAAEWAGALFNLLLNGPLACHSFDGAGAPVHEPQYQAAQGTAAASFSAGVRPWRAIEKRSKL